MTGRTSAPRHAKRGISGISVVSVILSGVFLVPLAVDRTVANATGVEVDKFIQLDSSDYLQTPQNFLSTTNPAALTIALWAKYEDSSPSGNDVIFRLGRNNDSRTMLYVDDGELSFLGFALSASSPVLLNFQPTENTWHHYAMVYKEDISEPDYKIYVDGREVGTVTSADLSLSSGDNTKLYLGGYGSGYFKGSLDEIKVFEAALTESELSTVMHSYGDGTGTGSAGYDNSALAAYYNFNDGTANDVDTSGTTNNLTVSGSVTYPELAATTTSGTDTIVSFPRSYITSSGGWATPTGVTEVDALIVAGGGAGGQARDSSGWRGGGGGGGGFQEVTDVSVTPGTSYGVEIGQGGLAGIGTSSDSTSGQNSTFSAHSTESVGGGRGGIGFSLEALSGGSGGGGAMLSGGGEGNRLGANGTTGQGYAGGDAPDVVAGNNDFAAGGGGGARSAGGDASVAALRRSVGGAPGDGEQSTITSGWYAGGGAGAGIGGNGSISGLNAVSAVGESGAANSGSGGGGEEWQNGAGNGGSGIVVLRYVTPVVPSQVQGFSAATRYVDAGTDEDSVTLNWTALTGQTPAVTGYSIEHSVNSDFSSPSAAIAVSGGSTTTATITGLDDGKTYYFQIKAVNDVGSSATAAETVSRAVSKEDYALDFDGSATVNGGTSIIPTADNAQFSVEAWVKPDSVTGYDTIVTQQTEASSNYFYLGLYQTGASYYVDVGRDTSDSLQAEIPNPTGKWMHIAVTVATNDDIELFIDGTKVKTFNQGNAGTGPNFAIGSYVDGTSYPFDGQIDQVKIWNDVRTQSEIVASMHAWGNPASSDTSLISHYDFNDNTQATTLRDQAGSNDLAYTSVATTDLKPLSKRTQQAAQGMRSMSSSAAI